MVEQHDQTGCTHRPNRKDEMPKMTSKAEQARLAFEAGIRANAVSYRVHLFLGRGQYERAEAATSDEALALGAAMKAAHPACQAQPIYYAIEPSGHSTIITPAQIQQEKTMTMTATNDIDAKRAKKAEAQARWRAKQKAAKTTGAANEIAADEAEQRRAAEAPKAKRGRKAAAEASRKEVAGVKAERKAAGRKAKAPAATRAAGGKRAEILAAAERGKLPAAPDFTAPTHTRFRDKLAQVVAMAKAGDLAGLKAFPINPISSSPKAIDRYRNLAVIALKARADQ